MFDNKDKNQQQVKPITLYAGYRNKQTQTNVMLLNDLLSHSTEHQVQDL